MIVTYPPQQDYYYREQISNFIRHDKNVLIIFVTAATFELGMPQIIRALNVHQGQQFDGILLHVFGESPPVSFYRTASNIIKECYGNNVRVAAADNGMSTEDPEYFTHIPLTCLDVYNVEFQPVQPSQRKYHFCSLNRVARPDRVRLVNQLHSVNLLRKGIVSLGSALNSFPYYEIMPPELVKQMPLTFDDIGNDLSLSTYYEPPVQVKQSIINLVSEGTVVQAGIHTVEDTFIRPLISEKTKKAFACYQFPIWLATPGFVTHLRHKGFDVFDDLIDHSYDSELHTVKRIEMIVNETKKIVDLGIEPLKALLEKHWSRLEHNIKHTNHVAWEINHDAEQRLRKWLRS